MSNPQPAPGNGPAKAYVACLGEALALLDPRADLDAPIEAGSAALGAAGLAGAEANVASALVASGVPASWVGRLGTDPLGEFLLAELVRRGVDTGAVEFDSQRPTGFYNKVVLGSGNQTRTEMRYRRTGSAAASMDPAFLERPAVQQRLAGARIIHTSGITAALSLSSAAMMRRLLTRPRPGQRLVFDVNWREQLWPDGDPSLLVELAAAADVVMVGADEARRVFGTDDPIGLRALLPNPEQILIKDGHLQALAVQRDCSIVAVQALRVEVLEPVGAGDAFAAGFLLGVLVGDSITRCLRRGHLTAARVLTVAGDSAAPFPNDMVEAALSCSSTDWRNSSVTAAGISIPKAVG